MSKKKKYSIPLFPLNFVLFPNSSIKIHIFEDKYKTMLLDCITSNKVFGIVLSIEGKIFNIGCTAKISQVVKIHKNGNSDITVIGADRFKLKNLSESNKPYLIGEVEFVEDIVEPFQINLKEDTIALYDELIKVVYKGSINTSEISKVVKNISFKVAEKIGLSLLQKQSLLELTSETQRLKIIFNFLRDIMPKLEDFNQVRSIIENDGYL